MTWLPPTLNPLWLLDQKHSPFEQKEGDGVVVPWTQSDVEANAPFFWLFTDEASQNYDNVTKIWTSADNIGTESSLYRLFANGTHAYQDLETPKGVRPMVAASDVYTTSAGVMAGLDNVDFCICIVAHLNGDQGQGTPGGRTITDRNVSLPKYIGRTNVNPLVNNGGNAPTIYVDGVETSTIGAYELALGASTAYIRMDNCDMTSWSAFALGDKLETVRAHFRYYAVALIPQTVADANSDAMNAYFESIRDL